VTELTLHGFSAKVNELWATVAEILCTLGEGGSEKAQFNLAANPGEPAYPLHKIASGGEVSRIMLGIKRALAAGAETCVLVFDEIDTGISGKVADVVGQKIKELGERFQVICISHLAQVAVYADAHYLVRKMQQKGRTESEIVRLSAEETASEVARLLSGPEVTDHSLANAQALITRAHGPAASL